MRKPALLVESASGFFIVDTLNQAFRLGLSPVGQSKKISFSDSTANGDTIANAAGFANNLFAESTFTE
jgi:hypothetical protein